MTNSHRDDLTIHYIDNKTRNCDELVLKFKDELLVDKYKNITFYCHIV
jgi:hypothetical protein